MLTHKEARISDSMLTDGTVVCEGALVERSVLSPGVFVGPGAIIRDSVILTDTYIEAGAVVERCVIDKIAVIGAGAHVGAIDPVGDLGITCVGKNTHVPAGWTIGRDCILGTDLRDADFVGFDDKTVPHGATIGYSRKKR